jgi:hypothetical protein
MSSNGNDIDIFAKTLIAVQIKAAVDTLIA